MEVAKFPSKSRETTLDPPWPHVFIPLTPVPLNRETLHIISETLHRANDTVKTDTQSKAKLKQSES